MEMAIIAIVLFVALCLLGIPIGWSLGISSLIALFVDGRFPLIIVPLRTIAGMNSFSLMAIPFFILAGNIMTQGGLTKHMLNIARVTVGWIRGSMSLICILASCFFSLVTGSAIATASAIGGTTIPEMIKEKYDRSYSAAVGAAAAICGLLIPPSIPLIVFASITGISVRNLFVGTIIPGIMYSVGICFVAYFIARKHNYQTHPRANFKEFLEKLWKGIPALIMPVIVLGCIFTGITTPTEASVIAVAYALIVTCFVYKGVTFKQLYKIFYDSAITTAVMFMLIGISMVLGWIIAITHLPREMTNWILGITTNPIALVTTVIIIGLLIGSILDVLAAVLILTPVLLPLAAVLPYSPVEFGVIFVTLMCLGHITPPLAASMLLTNQIAEANIGKTIVNALPFLLIGLAVVILCFIFPQLVSFLL